MLYSKRERERESQSLTSLVCASRYNLMLTEDLGQVRAGRTLSSLACSIDCEDYAQNNIHQAKSIMKVKHDMANMQDATLDMYMPPKDYPGWQTNARIEAVQGIYNLLKVRFVRTIVASFISNLIQ